MNNILMALIATTVTWAVTALGSALVIFFKKPEERLLNCCLGFAAGVMIAASFWSLLQPAVEHAENVLKISPYFIVTTGFLLGALFMWFTDKTVKSLNQSNNFNISVNRKLFVLVSSITLHNIPQGFAVGIAFGALNENRSAEALMCAVTTAIGIAIQNFPEGAAISLPLRGSGFSRKNSFLIGQASAIVEPIFGVIGAVIVSTVSKILPFALSFAAGTMITVAVHELIPECQNNKSQNEYLSTVFIILGFSIMTLLDVMLG